MRPRDRDELHENLRRLADGDRDAFAPVFSALWPLFRGFARRHLGEAEAEDVAQESLVKMFARASDFDAGRDGLAWSLGIVAWEVRTHRKRRARRREEGVEALAAHVAASPDPEASAVARETQERLEEALQLLSPADRETLALHASGERLPGATFRKRVQRALERLVIAWGSPP